MMNTRHLPAGQGLQHDMNRRRPYNQQHQQQLHQQQHQQQQQQQHYQTAAPMYNGYYNSSYYPPAPPQYQHNGMPTSQYSPYPSYGRSPPPQFQQYAHTPLQPMIPSYPRAQQSPAIATTPYLPPPPHLAPPAQVSQIMVAPSTPLDVQVTHASIPQAEIPLPPVQVAPPPQPSFQPPLPWLSRPDLPWPIKPLRSRRKRRIVQAYAESVELPNIQSMPGQQAQLSMMEPTIPASPQTEPSLATLPQSERNASTTPTTPSSLTQTSNETPASNVSGASNVSSKLAAAIPIIPAIPKALAKPVPSPTQDKKFHDEAAAPIAVLTTEEAAAGSENAVNIEDSKPSSPIATGPKLWANLFKGNTPLAASLSSVPQQNAASSTLLSSSTKTNSELLSDALRAFNSTAKDTRLSFLEPRGLINTGNMCYMNSVLQVLVFCIPFYNFLDQVGKQATHSFKSDTPMIDAMIMFMREFPIIDSAATAEQLRMRIKENELEQYGDSFTPEFVYDVIRTLPRFSSMRRGHQQDAEEFLGFLLEGLHDECVQVMLSTSGSGQASGMATPTNSSQSLSTDDISLSGGASGETANGWLEVGPKQRAAITRSSGAILLESPITKIFGGTLRSELRIPGLKNSVTMEPYQPLQLDIGSPHVNNIVDALRGLTRPETLHGDFKSPRGPGVTATKQVLIETLPSVLILHLKRFQYDNTGGTQKIWKKIGYPLELEIPKEVFSRQRQGSILHHGGLPKYRLIAVVYHHGKNASGGHYTVDVRRQDGQEWIRLDDTVIRRVRSADVADYGSEEDPKVLAAAMEAYKKDTSSQGNAFAQMKIDEDDAENGGEDEWKQVNGTSAATNGVGKKWSNVVDGASTPKARNDKFSVKDNKVAYLLFYQKIES